MRVHFKNVIASAIEAGVVTGYNDVLNKKIDDPNKVVDSILQHVWNALDDIVDFSEDEEESDRRQMGFAPPEPVYTDAISNDMLPSDEEEELEGSDSVKRKKRSTFKRRNIHTR